MSGQKFQIKDIVNFEGEVSYVKEHDGYQVVEINKEDYGVFILPSTVLTLVSRPKPKTRKYRWVLKSDKEVFVSSNYYTDKYDVRNYCEWEILQRIDSEFIEVEND